MRRSLVLATVLAATLTTAACGGSDDASSTDTGSAAPATATASAPAADAVTFKGVTVANPTDLKTRPGATSSATDTPTKLEYKDLVVGKGAEAKPDSTVNVQYEGILYKDGKGFDASWNSGSPISFPLQQVVPGFTQGIGGTKDVPPMKEGGRRVMILPPSLGYPNGTPDGSIPANSPIVFVVDLISVS